MSRQARTTVRGFCGEGVNKPRARLRGCYTGRLSNNAARAWHYDEFRGGGCESRGNLTCYEDGNPPTPITSSTLIVNDATSPACARSTSPLSKVELVVSVGRCLKCDALLLKPT